MSWSWERLVREWGVDQLHVAPSDVVAAFSTVERVLGPEWIARQDSLQGNAPAGAMVFPSEIDAMRVIEIGMQLPLIDRVTGGEELVDKLRSGDKSAEVELAALSLLIGKQNSVEVVVGPEVHAGNSVRRADFRLTSGSESVFVEVSRPLTSKAEEGLERRMQTTIDRMAAVPARVAIEVVFHREPTSDEIDRVVATAQRLSGQALPGLALVAVEDPALAHFPHVFAEFPYAVRLLRGGAPLFGPSRPSPVQHVSVTIPFTDERAEEFVRSESKQLPRDAPGLLVADVTGLPGAFKAWRPLVERRLQPKLNTRVGGVLLVRWSLSGQAGSRTAEHELVLNKHAAHRFPAWFAHVLSELR